MEVKIADEKEVKANDENHRRANVHEFLFPLIFSHSSERDDDVGVRHPEHDSEEVRKVVDPRQKAKEKEEEDKAEDAERADVWRLQEMPHVDRLDEEAPKNTQMRSRWPHLQSNTLLKDMVTSTPTSNQRCNGTK